MEGLNFYFIHIPKTGGTSIYNALEPFMDDVQHEHKPRCKVDTDKFTFAIVRNPYNWLGSHFEYVQMIEHHDSHIKDFNQYVKVFCERVKTQGIDGYCTQTKWAKGCDFIGKFEEIDEAWETILDRIGLDYFPLPHINKSKALKDYSYLYNADSIQLVNETFKEDFINYGYERR